MNHGDPKNPKKNPRPVKRYEVIATAEAPGPWDSVKGYIGYGVINTQCTPEDKFLGVHVLPRDIGQDIAMVRIDEKTWKGYFYRDSIEDEDYYGLGVCHWDTTSVTANFVVRGGTFGSGDVLGVLLKKGPQAEYFKKSEFLDQSRTIGAYGTTSTDLEVVQHGDAFFPITVAVKEVLP